MIYLGTPGRMIELKCPASQQLSADGEPSFQTTLGGRRIAQLPTGARRRAWQCQLSDASTPQEVGAVMGFINGEWGTGPFVFVSADAPVVNLLSPGSASCAPGSFAASGVGTAIPGGPLRTPDGWAGRSVLNSGSSPSWIEQVPVLPGVPVTASVYAHGIGGTLRLAWRDAAGAEVGAAASPALVNGLVARLHVTATPPANAVTCQLSLGAAVLQAARPAATWSDSPLEWGDGQGCPKVIIHGASRDLVMASRDPRGGRYSNLSFTVTEVG